MAVTITTLGDVFKTQLQKSFKQPTIWVDFDGVEHQDFEHDTVSVFTFSGRNPSDYRFDLSVPDCAYVKQIGSHVIKADKLVHPQITKDFVNFNPEIFKYAVNLEVALECFFNLNKPFEIPSDLFSSCTKLRVAAGVFGSCGGISSIPSELFSNCLDLLDVSNLFNGCSNLTQIPEDLFRNNSNLRRFNNTFSMCFNLVEIPAKLFSYCYAAESFNGCFSKCAFKTEIPEDLFRYNKKACHFSGCFLQYNPRPVSEHLFDYLDLSQPEYDFTALFQVGRFLREKDGPVDAFKKRATESGYQGLILC